MSEHILNRYPDRYRTPVVNLVDLPIAIVPTLETLNLGYLHV